MPLHLHPKFIEQLSKIQKKNQQGEKSYVEITAHLIRKIIYMTDKCKTYNMQKNKNT